VEITLTACVALFRSEIASFAILSMVYCATFDEDHSPSTHFCVPACSAITPVELHVGAVGRGAEETAQTMPHLCIIAPIFDVPPLGWYQQTWKEV